MTNKEIIKDCEFFNVCKAACGGTLDDIEICPCYELFKQLQAKEQECEELKQWKKDAENLFRTQTDNADKIINRYKQALDEIEENIKQTCSQRCTNDCLGTRKHCGYGHILNIIKKAKEG